MNLKWQTGPIPEEGWYWTRKIKDKTDLQVYTEKKGTLYAYYEWAGPIPYPEDVEV